MLTKPVYYCWLLVTLGVTAALAQTPPKKRRRQPVAVTPPQKTRMQEAEEAFIHNTYEALNHNCYEATRRAQPELPDSNRVYTYVEHMPTLPGPPLAATTAAAIGQRLQRLVVRPPDAPAGRVLVQFVVTKQGVVSQPQIVKGLRADVDSAVVTAVRNLPRLTPGKQGGQVVPVSFTLPVTIPARQQP